MMLMLMLMLMLMMWQAQLLSATPTNIYEIIKFDVSSVALDTDVAAPVRRLATNCHVDAQVSSQLQLQLQLQC